MSLGEVTQILGVPPGHFDPITKGWPRNGVAEVEMPAPLLATADVMLEGLSMRVAIAGRPYGWYGDGGTINVLIGGSKVLGKSYMVPVSPFRAKVGGWFRWLRGLRASGG
jgi:hypothetical protein